MLDDEWVESVTGEEKPNTSFMSFEDRQRITGVVAPLLAEDAPFTREEAADLIETALQDEARAILAEKAQGDEQYEAMIDDIARQERVTQDLNELTPDKHGAQDFQDEVNRTYDQARMHLAQVIGDVKYASAASFKSETRELIDRLDHDGLMSEQIGNRVEVLEARASRAAREKDELTPNEIRDVLHDESKRIFEEGARQRVEMKAHEKQQQVGSIDLTRDVPVEPVKPKERFISPGYQSEQSTPESTDDFELD